MPFSMRARRQLADFLGRRDVAAGLLFALLAMVEAEAMVPVRVVDHLRVDVVERAVHVQARTLGGAGHLLADAV
jgi:hypothetical protein